MKVSALRPAPTEYEPFSRDRLRYVPATSGCYVLATVGGDILYAGLAVNLRNRMGQHLDNPEKTGPTPLGVAISFHWYATTTLEPVERGWLNSHCIVTGALPPMNKVQSPVSG